MAGAGPGEGDLTTEVPSFPRGNSQGSRSATRAFDRTHTLGANSWEEEEELLVLERRIGVRQAKSRHTYRCTCIYTYGGMKVGKDTAGRDHSMMLLGLCMCVPTYDLPLNYCRTDMIDLNMA